MKTLLLLSTLALFSCNNQSNNAKQNEMTFKYLQEYKTFNRKTSVFSVFKIQYKLNSFKAALNLRDDGSKNYKLKLGKMLIKHGAVGAYDLIIAAELLEEMKECVENKACSSFPSPIQRDIKGFCSQYQELLIDFSKEGNYKGDATKLCNFYNKI